MQMASVRGSLGPLGGSSFTFNNPMGDTEMADAAHVTPNFHDNRHAPLTSPHMRGPLRLLPLVLCGSQLGSHRVID